MRRDGISIEAQIAAFADGTLAGAFTPEEEARLRERIEGSAQLSQALARQQQALAIVGSLHDVKAPAELHASVQALVAEHAGIREGRLRGLRRRLPRLSRSRSLPSRAPVPGARTARPLAGAAALAALLVALVLALAGEPASAPTVAQAARLALRPATLPSPSENAPRSDTLDIAVEGLAYPYWQGSLGWRATGSRRDRLGGRTVTTVFYERASGGGGARIGYAIVSGRSLSLPRGVVVVHRGRSFRVLAAQGATVVTWRRAGHTCILVASHVAAGRLMDLASWQ